MTSTTECEGVFLRLVGGWVEGGVERERERENQSFIYVYPNTKFKVPFHTT